MPSALGVLRHADIYKTIPDEIEEAFAVLERHVVCDGQLYPVAIAALPFLFATLRKGSFVSTRIADLIALYASTAHTLDAPIEARVRSLITDHAGEIVRWLGSYDRALHHDLPISVELPVSSTTRVWNASWATRAAGRSPRSRHRV